MPLAEAGSQYVKLKKENITEQPAAEEGELSQPVEVPQVLECSLMRSDCNLIYQVSN